MYRVGRNDEMLVYFKIRNQLRLQKNRFLEYLSCSPDADDRNLKENLYYVKLKFSTG